MQSLSALNLVFTGEGRDGSLRVAPLRKKHTSWKNTTPVHASELPKNEDLKDQQSGNWTAPPELFEPPGSCETGSDSGEIGDDSLRQLKMHSDDPEGESLGFLEGLEESPVEIQAPKLQKTKLSHLKENTVFPESDPVRHQRFVEKLVAQSDQNRGLQESWYEKPPSNGRLTYTPLESQVVELKARYVQIDPQCNQNYRNPQSKGSGISVLDSSVQLLKITPFLWDLALIPGHKVRC